MQLSVHEGGGMFLQRSGFVPSSKQTRSGGEIPGLPTLSSARAAMQTQPSLPTPSAALIADVMSHFLPVQTID